MTADPTTWARILSEGGPIAFAIVVLVIILAATFTASVTLITLLIRHILTDERIPKAVWVAECQSHATEMAALDRLAMVIEKMVWVMEQGIKRGGV